MYEITGTGLGDFGAGGKCYTPEEVGLDPELWEGYPGLCVAEGSTFCKYVSTVTYPLPAHAAVAADLLEAQLKNEINKGEDFATTFATEEMKGAEQDGFGFWHAVIHYIAAVGCPDPLIFDPSPKEVGTKIATNKRYRKFLTLPIEDLRVGRGATGSRVESGMRVSRSRTGVISAPERSTPEVPTAAEVEEGFAPAAAGRKARLWFRRNWKWFAIGGAGLVGTLIIVRIVKR